MNTSVNKFPGKLLALFAGLYGVHVYGQLILYDSKGFLLSTFVALWFLITFSFIFNNIFQQIITIAYKSLSKLLLLLFIVYTLLNSLFNLGMSSSTYSISFIFNTIIPGFLLGILSDANYSRFFFIGSLLKKKSFENIIKKYFKLVLLIGFLFILYQISLFQIDFNWTLFTVNNVFYQSLGDYYIIFYCGLLAIRENSIKSSLTERFSFSFNLIVIVEILISVFFLQLTGSNKAPLTIVAIGTFYLYYNGSGSLKSRFRQLIVLFIIFLLGYIAWFRFFDFDQISGLRFFREAQDDNVLNNSSWTSRFDQWSEYGANVFIKNLIFGDINNTNYLHSSIATVITHTGLIGTLMFLMFFGAQGYYIYFRTDDKFLKSVTFPIIFVSVISSVFWWLPLWFLAGLIYARK